MISPDFKKLSVVKQCQLLGVSRSSYYRQNSEAIARRRAVDQWVLEVFWDFPTYGSRRISRILKRRGFHVGRDAVRSAMKRLGIEAVRPKRNLSKANKQHKKYPYLLKNVKVKYANHVWATDITYIKINGSFVYLSAILDLYSRKVLAWRLSNTLDIQFCLETLNEAFALYGTPEIFNTDQGSQYTSNEHIEALDSKGIKISMDGKGRATDNAFIERLWRTIKYEDIFIRDYSSVMELKAGVKRFFQYYNEERIHQSLEYQTPDEVYYNRNAASSAA